MSQTPERPASSRHPGSMTVAESIVETVREPMLVLEKDLRVRQANASFYRHFQVERNETVGSMVYDLGNGQWNIPALRDLLEKVLSEKSFFNDFEVQHTFERIGQRSFLLNARRIDDLNLILLAMEDVTDRKKALHELQESEARFQLLFQSIDEGFCIIEMLFDDNGKPHDYRFLEVNRIFESETGITDAVGRRIREIAPEIEEHWFEIFGRVALTGEPIRFQRPSEALGRYYDVYAFRIGKPDQRQVAILFSDISERRQMEQSLRESEKRFRQLADSMPQLVWSADPEGNVDYCNVQWLEFAGLSQGADGRFEWAPSLHPDDAQRTIDAWRTAVRTGSHYQIEHRAKTADGSFAWLLSRANPIRDEGGRIIRWYGTSTDIDHIKRAETELEEAKKAAEEANLAKSEFLANMSHEIRTPMTIFLVALEHLLGIDRNQERRRLLEMADQAAQRLRSLIDDILDFSRIEARRVELVQEPFDLRACLDDAAKMFELPAREKKLRLETEVAADVPQVVICDGDRIGQILTNLIGNAVKFTHEGEIRVSVRHRGNLLEFTVADTGIGFPENKIDLLFQSFSQVDSSLTRRYGGTGLGLAICKSLVDLMGGQIQARKRKGKGSAFTFTVPLKPAELENLTGAGEPQEPLRGDNPTAPILLVEDEPPIRELIVMMLATRGWQAETARSGGEAVEKWTAGNFKIILMDLQMPGMDGLEATREIRRRAAENGKRTCIIGLTAHAYREIKDNCLEAGMDMVLTKPVRMADLYSAIDSCQLE